MCIRDRVAFDRDGKKIKTFGGAGNHFENFLKAVRSRKHEDLNADILDGHLSSALCHLGNISLSLGSNMPMPGVRKAAEKMSFQDDGGQTLDRVLAHLNDNQVDLKEFPLRVGQGLKIDAAVEKFVDHDQANQMLTRQYRKPFIVPETRDL